MGELAANGVPLGIMPDINWPAPDSFEMKPGDMMVLVTDGFFEWQNAAKAQFGMDRTFGVIRTYRDCASAEIIRHLHEAVVAFAGDLPQADDLTALIVKKT